MKRTRILLWLGLVTAGGAAMSWLPMPWRESDERGPVKVADASSREEPVADARWAALPKRQALEKASRNPFIAPGQVAPKAAALKAPAAVEAPSTPPPPPYRIAGKVVQAGEERFVLARGNQVLLVRPGDRLEDGYEVESIQPDHVVLVHPGRGTEDKVPVTFAFVIDDASPEASAGASGKSRR